MKGASGSGSRRSQRAVHGHEREGDGQTVIGSQSHDRDTTAHIVKGCAQDLRGLKVDARVRISDAFVLLAAVIALMVVEGEAGIVALPFDRAIAVRLVARRRCGRPGEGVVAAEAIDLQGHVIGLGLRVRPFDDDFVMVFLLSNLSSARSPIDRYRTFATTTLDAMELA